LPNAKSLAIVPNGSLLRSIPVRKFVINKIPIFIDSSGNVIDVEPGQADGGVLISQNNSLVYYLTVVNDLFAYHRTMQGPALIPIGTNLTFPMTISDANAVVAFAASKGHAITDPKALAFESKTSWVLASSVPNPSDYIQVNATIPTYDKTDPNNWIPIPNGQVTAKLVMVGMHVVGSTLGHGEMVWGTFEHIQNAANDIYAYDSTSGMKVIVRNTSGSWLFTQNGTGGPFNTYITNWNGASIVGTPVGPTVVLRAKPWGSNDGGSPISIASMNTQVISTNASVISQLDPADVRVKYFQQGTTWTIAGAAPNSGNQVGTNHLANTTMETFAQGSSSSDSSTNCFSCHQTNKVEVSHIYRQLKPLP
jgi:hypothetical protein